MTLTLSPAKVGTWALHEVLTHDQVNKIASELVKAVDGVGGGSYSLTVADLTFTGSRKAIFDLAVQLTAGKVLSLDGSIAVTASGHIDLASGASINVAAGASIALATGSPGGAIAAAAGSKLTGSLALNGEIVVKNAGLVTVENGGIVNVQNGGAVVFARTQDLKIFSQVATFRSTMRPQWIEKTTGFAGDEVWYDNNGDGTWIQSKVTARRIRFPVELPPGDELTTVFVNFNGSGGGVGHSGVLPATLPLVRLFKMSATGVKTVLAETSDTSASAAIYDAFHLVSLTHGTETLGLMPATITTDPHYIEILGEFGSGALDGALQLLAVFGVTKQTLYRSGTEFH
jgi:hypothetical protein